MSLVTGNTLGLNWATSGKVSTARYNIQYYIHNIGFVPSNFVSNSYMYKKLKQNKDIVSTLKFPCSVMSLTETWLRDEPAFSYSLDGVIPLKQILELKSVMMVKLYTFPQN